MDRRDFLALAGAAVLGGVAAPAWGQTTDLAELPMAEAIARLRRRAVSPVDLVRACLSRIDAHDASLHAFITVTGEQALAEARSMEARSASRPVARPAARHPHRAQGQHRHRRRAYDRRQRALRSARPGGGRRSVAAAASRLAPILLGKTNLHEFAYGGSCTVDRTSGRCRTLAPSHVPGRVVRRLRRGGRRGPVLRLARHRHRPARSACPRRAAASSA